MRKPEELVPTLDAALFAGRFTMQIPGRDTHDVYGKLLPRINFEHLMELKLLRLTTVYISRGDQGRVISKKRLESTCTQDETGWRLKEEYQESGKVWEELLKTDSPFVLVSRGNCDAASDLVANLVDVAVFADHGNFLSDELLLSCKNILGREKDAVIVGIGVFRSQVEFFGRPSSTVGAVSA